MSVIDGEVLIVNALEEDKEFLDLLKVTDEYWKIHRTFIPMDHSNNYPYIRVSELNNVDNRHADNKAVSSYIPIQIDLWVREGEDSHPMTEAIDRIMKSISFDRTGLFTFHEDETNSVRKVHRYENTILLGEE